MYRRGRSRLAHGMPKSAISSFQVVLNSQPDHQEALYHLLIAYVRAGQEKALEVIKNVPNVSISEETFSSQPKFKSAWGFHTLQPSGSHAMS